MTVYCPESPPGRAVAVPLLWQSAEPRTRGTSVSHPHPSACVARNDAPLIDEAATRGRIATECGDELAVGGRPPKFPSVTPAANDVTRDAHASLIGAGLQRSNSPAARKRCFLRVGDEPPGGSDSALRCNGIFPLVARLSYPRSVCCWPYIRAGEDRITRRTIGR
jgi:hypothetical protein